MPTACSGENGLVPIRRLPTAAVRPSPENDQLYRPVDPADPDFLDFVESVRARGILDPLVITQDYFILSGHRRHAAARRLGLAEVPCRVKPISRTEMIGTPQGRAAYLALLRDQ